MTRRTDIVLTIPADKVPTAGTPIDVPVDDGREYWEMGEIIATEVQSDGRIRLCIELGPGMELSEPPPADIVTSLTREAMARAFTQQLPPERHPYDPDVPYVSERPDP